MTDHPLDSASLRQQFSREAEQRLKEVETGLLNIEQGQDLSEQIRLIFRGFHGLKGVALYVNAREIIDLTNAGETLLMLVRDQGVSFRTEWIDVLLGCHDTLEALLEAFRSSQPPGDQWRDSLTQLKRIIAENSEHGESGHGSDQKGSLFIETAEAEIGGLEVYLGKWKPGIPDRRLVMALTRKLKLFSRSAQGADRQDVVDAVNRTMDSLDRRKEESWSLEQIVEFSKISEQLRALLKSAPASTRPKVADIPASETQRQPAERRSEIKVAYIEMLEALVSDFSVYSHSVTAQMHKMRSTMKPRARLWLEGMSSDLARFSRAFSQSLRRLHLVPVSTVFERFPRMVRDMAKREGKKVRLSVVGADTELEGDQVEKLAEPITHLLRNAVDHGVESLEERRNAGKNEQASVTLRASAVKGLVTIEVSDDGRGIDFDAIRKKAVDLNLYSGEKAQEIPAEELVNLIFLTGLSTKSMADTISGRGVGMDIVRQSMEELDGRVEVASQPGKGTTFSLSIPLDLDY